MKKLIAALLVLTLAFAQVAFATEATEAPELPDLTAYTDEQLTALSEALEAELATRNLLPQEERETLQKGSKGDAVKELQLRLIELNYLSGSADGDFGGKTKSAVEMFQRDAGLPVNGIADAATQDAAFADDAPLAKVYLDLDFKAISRDPNSYAGKSYKFSGKVVQVLEHESQGTNYISLRVATKGNYDNVVYVDYSQDSDASRILEDDRVTVYGVCEGLDTYETIMGGTVTLPKFQAESVTVN